MWVLELKILERIDIKGCVVNWEFSCSNYWFKNPTFRLILENIYIRVTMEIYNSYIFLI